MASGIGAQSRISKRLILSYIIDWITIIAIAAVGAAFSVIAPNKRPFDVTDANISFPYVKKEKVSTGLLIAIGLAIPAVITFLVCVVLIPGPRERKPLWSSAFQRKLWEWNVAWMGLGVSLAVAFLVTDGTKNLVGKPRPDLLARCDPDLSRILNSTVGGIGDQVNEGINLVSWTICRNPGSILDDGFRSFPSGHSSFSFAGLTYLTLFLCAKLAISIPFLRYDNTSHRTYAPGQNTSIDSPNNQAATNQRDQAAAPPTYLIIVALIPMSLAIYVSSTRYSDFMHHGFDIISGAILGIASAWLGFRWYHLPITRGAGWAWAPRGPDRAFGRGIGLPTYTSNDETSRRDANDLESGPIIGEGAVGEGIIRPYKNSEGSEGIELTDTRYAEPARASESSRRSLG